METKSRYEVLADLQESKMKLIRERDSFSDRIDTMDKTIKICERDVEDKKEELQKFKDKVEERKETINELIKSIDESLARFANMKEKK